MKSIVKPQGITYRQLKRNIDEAALEKGMTTNKIQFNLDGLPDDPEWWLV